MRKISFTLTAFLMTGCASFLPYGKDTQLTESYYYSDSVKARAVYTCMQGELFSRGYLIEYGKFDNKYGINRFDVTHKTESVASLEINTSGSSVTSQAFVKNGDVRKDLEAAQSACVKYTEHSTSLAGSIIEGIREGLK